MTVLIGQKEGLPDIYGKITLVSAGTVYGIANKAGVFNNTTVSGNAASDQSGGSSGDINLTFYASQYNSIYGASSHVQPVNLTVRCWKRTA